MGETPRILIVDDDDEIRSILCDFLSRQYSCKTLDCAQHALSLLAHEKFDLVLSDIGMPGMTGLEMIPRITYIAPDTSIVMISGQRMIESAIAARRRGALDYITKPFELGQVDDVVRRALAHTGRKRDLWSSDHSRDERTKTVAPCSERRRLRGPALGPSRCRAR